MTGRRRPEMALLFTPGVTLEHWRGAGLLLREVRYYEALARRLGPVVFVHEGRAGAAADLGAIEVISNAAGLPAPLFWLRAPFDVARRRGRPSIVKTNQLAGAVAAALAKAMGAKVVARGGWVPAERWWHPTAWHPRRLVALAREAILVRIADIVFVSTAESAAGVEARQRLARCRVRVLPNHVDVERFGVERPKVAGLVTSVGRLSPQKDPVAMIEAVARVPGARLRLIGEGPLRAAAERRARELKCHVEFLGVVPHERLPEFLAETEVYLSASWYEGHPKSLIEAMAAGAACLARRAPGVTSLLDHARTGFLSDGTSVEALARGLAELLADRALRERIGRAARREARDRYALERVLDRECDAYREAGWLADGRDDLAPMRE